MKADPHAVQISVDGSCYPNEGRKSGYAGVVVYPDDPTDIPEKDEKPGLSLSAKCQSRLEDVKKLKNWCREISALKKVAPGCPVSDRWGVGIHFASA
jgi:hypothetical protein